MAGLTLIILWVHLLVLVAVLIVLAVPSWRLWFLSTYWSPLFVLLAAFGAFYSAIFWPDALGGWSVGLPLVLAMVGALAIWLVVSFINEWRTDRASAIETLALIIVVGASGMAAELFIGRDYYWLTTFPLIGWFVLRWFIVGGRAP